MSMLRWRNGKNVEKEDEMEEEEGEGEEIEFDEIQSLRASLHEKEEELNRLKQQADLHVLFLQDTITQLIIQLGAKPATSTLPSAGPTGLARLEALRASKTASAGEIAKAEKDLAKSSSLT
jgi:hypothetical protein